MHSSKHSRRRFVKAAACATLPLYLAPKFTLATAPGDQRVIIIVLRGAMDGLHLLQPIGDRNYKSLRPTLSKINKNQLLEINDLYALNITDTGENFKKLWTNSDLSFIQAVSTPYRGTRSHFDGQDILETGGNRLGEHRTGWLTRMVEAIGGLDSNSAFTVSPNGILLGRGLRDLKNLSPGTYLPTDIVSLKELSQLYESDNLFADILKKSEILNESHSPDSESYENSITGKMTSTVINQLNNESRIAAFSIDGWDTHANQKNTISAPLQTLVTIISRLKKGLAQNWTKTTIVCVTEFGRTARENGVGGTDHGTGGMVILSGGAIIGKQIHGNWPGLSEKSLYEGRDLLPTNDTRMYLASIFGEIYNTSPKILAKKVFNLEFTNSLNRQTKY